MASSNSNGNTQPALKMQQLIKSDRRRMFSSSDDGEMMKQIQATHSPDGREVDVKPILNIIEDILGRAIPTIDGVLLNGKQEQVDTADDKMISTSQLADFLGVLEELAYLIHKISCELSCKCSGGGSDAHATTMALFNTLSSFSWDSKVVIALAAFAVNCGEFWLVAELWTTNPLAKSVAFLKQLPDMLQNANSLKPQFDALKKLVKVIIDVTKCIIEFKELPSQYISYDTPPMSTATAHVPIAAYWTVRSIVACASQIASLIGLRHENTASATEAWELSSLAHKVSNIHEHLRNQLAVCYQHIEEKIHLERYHNLFRLFETLQIDNMKTLKALICPMEELQIGTTTKTKASIEVLKRKHVLLLISDLDISQDEILALSHVTGKSQRPAEAQYEVIWLPILDRSTVSNNKNTAKFEHLQSMMPWYTVLDPWIIEPAVIKYIKEVWHFAKMSILVSLDQQGRVVSQNALHMLWIWGNSAFPFNSEKEEALWKSETWRIELLVDAIDPEVINSIANGRIVCLYGGEDIEWIRKFTATAQAVAKAAKVTLEIFYVGKSNAKERVFKNNEIIKKELLSRHWPQLTSIWFFWKRLESMLYSKLQHGSSVEKDRIMKEVTTMLSFDSGDQGWALVYGGPTENPEIARAKGDIALTCLQEFETWKDDAENSGFVPALKNRMELLHLPHHCNRLILPSINGGILETVVCAECSRPMEKYFMYRCCVED